jgi:hypothetical protein
MEPQPSLGRLGNAEGPLAALLVIGSLMLPSDPSHPLGETLCPLMFALGGGLAIGGLRYGSALGRFLACSALVVMSLVFVSIALDSVSDWPRLPSYWMHHYSDFIALATLVLSCVSILVGFGLSRVLKRIRFGQRKKPLKLTDHDLED